MIELKNKAKVSKGSGKEIDQAEQLDVLLNQSVKVLNKNCETEVRDACITSKQENRFHAPFNSKYIQMEIIITEKKTLI